MDVYRVSFFGHRKIQNWMSVDNILENMIRDLLIKNTFVEFLVGRDGDFDQIVSSAINRCKRLYRADNSSHIWVLPYTTADLRDYEDDYLAYYNEIEVCSESSIAHYKAAFQIRNRSMINRSNLVVFYVDKNEGGAYNAMQYARTQDVQYVNIYDIIK